ncbi:MAG: flagellar biosynthesis anti-sigma factor FlgM [Planctomycetales bacterium]
MDVTGPGSVQGAFPVRPVERSTDARPAEAARPAGPQPVRDEVEISSVGRMMENMTHSSEVRGERLAQIKAAIDAGTYETPEKFEAALDKMFREIGLRNE